MNWYREIGDYIYSFRSRISEIFFFSCSHPTRTHNHGFLTFITRNLSTNSTKTLQTLRWHRPCSYQKVLSDIASESTMPAPFEVSSRIVKASSQMLHPNAPECTTMPSMQFILLSSSRDDMLTAAGHLHTLPAFQGFLRSPVTSAIVEVIRSLQILLWPSIFPVSYSSINELQPIASRLDYPPNNSNIWFHHAE